MAKATFATPLPQSVRSETLEWHFPKPYQAFTLTGKSRAAWHTSFVIPQLNLLLDAGLVVNKARPKHIFLTHGHSDHTLLAPAFINREDPPDVFCPREMEGPFEGFMRSARVLNRGGADGDGDEEEEEEVEEVVIDKSPEQANQGKEANGEGRPELDAWGDIPTHRTHGLKPGDTVPLRWLKPPMLMTATAFACDHNVPSIGYVFHATTQRLLPQYTGLPGPELKALRKSGTEITGPYSVPVFAFLGDGQATTLASEPEWLKQGVKVVITECSFLREEHRATASKTKHTIWSELESVVRKWKDVTFVITHFSLRYTDQDVREFFKGLEDCPRNIVVWVDGFEGGEGGRNRSS